jgi:hypothetical protein
MSNASKSWARCTGMLSRLLQTGAWCALLLAACDHEQAAPTPTPTAAASVASASSDGDAGYARQLAGRFGDALKKELTAGLNAGGPVAAIAVCSDKAPGIADSLAMKEGWSVRRTSLKLRNPDNAPDAWERAVLERFERDAKSGKAIDSLEVHEIVDENGQRAFRYMKAIGTPALCISCHGGSIDDAVTAALDERYPRDQARGFGVGDVRGAFSVRARLRR